MKSGRIHSIGATGAIFLKLFADCALLLAFASGLAGMIGVGGATPMAALVLALAGAASGGLAARGRLRLLPLALLPLALLFAEGLGGALALLLPAAYLVYTAVGGRFGLEGFDPGGTISLFLKLYLPFLVFPALLGGAAVRTALERRSIPFAILCLASLVLLGRSQRHDEAVRGQTAFQLYNLAAMLPLFLAAVAASSPLALSLLGRGLGLFFSLVTLAMVPLLLVVALLIWALMALLMLVTGGGDEAQEVLEIGAEAVGEYLGVEYSGGGDVARLVFQILGAVIALVVAVLVLRMLFRRLLGARSGPDRPGRAAYAVIEPPPRRGRRESRRGPRRQIRVAYRRYLGHCRQAGVPLLPCHTTAEVSELAGPHAGDAELRELYRQARYGPAEPDAAQVRRMREALAEARRDLRGR